MKLLIYTSLLFFCVSLNGQNSGVTVHEWGTFTTLCGSNGQRLSGLQLAEEPVPPFVYNLAMRYYNEKGMPNSLSLTNVTVKMETPVLYFYSDKSVPFKIKVDFNGGLISQWYPQRSNGSQHLINDQWGYVPQPSTYNHTFLDFTNTHGFIEWTGTILPPDSSRLTQKAAGQHVWLAPRETQSNLVQVSGTDQNWGPFNETEKYLFYRGIGNFDIPVKLNFDERGRLNITNTGNEQLSYVMVYNKPYDGGEAEIWWSGSLDAGSLANTRQIPGMDLTVSNEMEKFKAALVSEGLYEDEAAAMLSTWKQSYFEVPGLKVFWIVSRNLTDKILPLEMTPVPDRLERVLVGRSEILTPTFEKEMFEAFSKKYNTAFMQTLARDRYYLAYAERYSQMKSSGDTLFQSPKSDDVFTVYPNPAGIVLNIYKEGTEKTGNIDIEITDITGRSVDKHSFTPDAFNDYIFYSLDCSQYAAGLYFVRITNNETMQLERVVIRR
ncbi:MAG TPA: T9SS type A sorting domain-containing protein [Bacteroidia bacterium]|nr:T9SS type A sorting domain-containing protein [Bacteroidia bacterium]